MPSRINIDTAVDDFRYAMLAVAAVKVGYTVRDVIQTVVSD